MNPRRLYRCRHDRQLAGVAAGMAEYLGLDPTLVRVLWVVSIFFGGVTILLYIILAFVMPLEPDGPIGAPAPVRGSAGSAGAAFGPTGSAAASFGPAAGSIDPAGDATNEDAGEATPASAGASTGVDAGRATGVGIADDPGLATVAGMAPGEASIGSSAWPAHRHDQLRDRQPGDRPGGRAALVGGILLVVIGGMALAHTLFPGTVFAVAVGPAFLVVLGVALLAASVRRTANAR